uniref:CSON011179 protein n=1 Tax=Culicoides sonorensis TaxID=179676 RepID=A0A336LMJ0_CULSO
MGFIYLIIFIVIIISKSCVFATEDFKLDFDSFGNYLYVICEKNKTVDLDKFKEKVDELKIKAEDPIHLLQIEYCRPSFSAYALINITENETKSKIHVLELKELQFDDPAFFNGVDDLKDFMISIEGNKEKLPSNVFSKMQKLKNIKLQIDDPENLPEVSILQSLKSLYIITGGPTVPVKQSIYRTLLSDILSHVTHDIIEFHLEATYVKNISTELSVDSFSHHISLEKLYLSLGIEKIHEKTFAGLKNLTILNLASNKLKEFRTNYLPDSLKILELNGNQIKKLTFEKPFINLIALDLTYSKVESFELDLIDKLKNLEKLDLKNNPLRHLKILSSDVVPLKQLNLKNVSLDEPDVWVWALLHFKTTSTDLSDTYQLCNCDSMDIIEELNKNITGREDIRDVSLRIDKCRVPVSNFLILTDLPDFPCPNQTQDCGFYVARPPTNRNQWSAVPNEYFFIFNCSYPMIDNPDSAYKDELIKRMFNRMFNEQKYNDKYFFIYHGQMKSLPMLSKLTLENEQSISVYASNTGISKIERSHLPNTNFANLNLMNNNIKKLDMNVLEHLSQKNTKLNLSGNPLICDCSHVKMVRKITSLQVLDLNQMKCNDGILFNEDRELCISPGTVLLYFLSAVLAVIAIGLAFYLRNSLEIKVFIYSRGWFPAYFRPTSDDIEYQYDAFLSYSEKDEKFVMKILKLLEENSDPPFKVCYHHRDWMVGERIDHQIIRSVDESRKTIIVLSRNFLESHWSNMEFITAHYKMLEEKSPKILLILHGEIDTRSDLTPELKSYIKTTTYLKSDDQWFKKKLLYALRRPVAQEN